jgi:hypothetical protein
MILFWNIIRISFVVSFLVFISIVIFYVYIEYKNARIERHAARLAKEKMSTNDVGELND